MLPRLRSKVLLAGSLLGLAGSLLFDFLLLRPNRLAEGEGLSLFQALQWHYWLPLLLFWAYFLFRSFTGSERLGNAELLPAVLAPAALLFLLGEASTGLLSQAPPMARASVGSGFWISCLALFLLLLALYSKVQPGWPKPWLFGAGAAIGLWILLSGRLNDLSVIVELLQRQGRFWAELSNHAWITGVSVSISTCAGIPLGLAVVRQAWLREKAFFVLNIVQTIPGLALFGLLIAPLTLLVETVPLLGELGIQGIGWTPAVIALTLYAMLPIVRNTYAGFSGVEPELREAGRGMGMNRVQLLFLVELPRALPVLLGGLRIAIVQNVGNTALAALIGAGGLGVFIFQGLGQAALDLILLGALPTIALAAGIDAVFQALIRFTTPRGLR